MAIDPVAVIRAMAKVDKDDVSRMFRRSDFHDLFEQIREDIGRDRLEEGEKRDLAAYIVLLYVGPKSIRGRNEQILADELRVLLKRLRKHHKNALKACRDRFAAARTEKSITWIKERLGDPVTLMSEVALAYLNGWKRAKKPNRELPDWDETPTQAGEVLRTYIGNTVESALAWFRAHTEIPLGDAPDYELSKKIYNRISTGTCRCSVRLRKPNPHVNHTKFSYRKRKKKCLAQHRLSAWRPEEMNLWAFLGRAVTGALGRSMKSSSLESGMFWDRFDKHLGGTNDLPRLYLGRVAQWVCPHCGHPTVFCLCYHRGVEACKRAPPFDSRHANRIVTRAWVVDRLRYFQRPAVFCHDPECGNFYPIDKHDDCPRCGQPRDAPAPGMKAIDLRNFPVHNRVWFPILFRKIHEIQVRDIDHL